MNLEVRRRWFTDRSTIGELWVDRQFECFTLEPPQREDKPRAIPPATYDVVIRWSPRFQRLMPHVENVKDFEGVLIHWGNRPEDTEGCLLVGKGRAPDWVATSKEAFNDLFILLREELEPITITYTVAPHEYPALESV